MFYAANKQTIAEWKLWTAAEGSSGKDALQVVPQDGFYAAIGTQGQFYQALFRGAPLWEVGLAHANTLELKTVFISELGLLSNILSSFSVYTHTYTYAFFLKKNSRLLGECSWGNLDTVWALFVAKPFP